MKKTNRVLALLLIVLSVMCSCSSNSGTEQTERTQSKLSGSSVQTEGRDIDESNVTGPTYDGVWLGGDDGTLLSILGENCDLYVLDYYSNSILTLDESINQLLTNNNIPSYSTGQRQYLENIKLDCETGIMTAKEYKYIFHGDTRTLEKQFVDENFSLTIKLDGTNHAVMEGGADGPFDLVRIADCAEELENLKIMRNLNGYWRASSPNEEILLYDSRMLIPISEIDIEKQSEKRFNYRHIDGNTYMEFPYFFLSNGRLVIVETDDLQMSVYNYKLTNGELTIEGLTKALGLSNSDKIMYTYQGECPFEIKTGSTVVYEDPDWGNIE